MTTTVLRPNRDALDKGLNIYRDAMRPFTLRGLRRVSGMTAQYAIRTALPSNVYAQFSANSRKPGASLKDTLDVNHFPHIIRRFWQETFRHEFQDERGVWNRLWIIAEARNQVAHPAAKDLDADIAADALFNIAYILRAINASEESATVQKIREGVTAPPMPSSPTPPVNPPPTPSYPTPPVNPTPMPASPTPPFNPPPTPTTQAYGVYTDLIFKYSTIHKTTCRFWKNRKLDLNQDENHWRGPYATIQQATTNPDTRGNVKRGGCCKP